MSTNNNINGINSDRCYACTMCGSICSVGAISFGTDRHGFYVPIVDETKCLACGMCVKGCPAIHRWQSDSRSLEHKAFGCKGNDKDREKSSSGAVFPSLARMVVARGGKVCGCILNDELKAEHIVTDDPVMIGKMSDSKYVQSDVGDCFAEILVTLRRDKPILFSGTSCQVHGLIEFLKYMKQSRENLLCVDLICHGVPSPKIFRDYLMFYKTEKRTNVEYFKFRSKLYGWGDGIGACNYIQTIGTKDGEDNRSFVARLWQNVFFSDLCIRECCFSCPYTTINKPADITLGDYWGVSSDMPGMNDKKGTSLVITHNKKGEKALADAGIVMCRSEDFDRTIRPQSRLRSPISMPEKYDKFWDDHAQGFSYLARKYFKYSNTSKIKYFIKRKLYDWHMYRIANKLFREILF